MSAAPIEFKYLGISDDKEHIRYQIVVKTDKPIEQVDMHVDYLDADGNSMMDSTLIWQNIVGTTRNPIVAGQTYDAEDYLLPDTAKVKLDLQQVVFKDMTSWKP